METRLIILLTASKGVSQVYHLIQGEWYNNKKYGYGTTTFKDGRKEEGKYKNNVLISSGHRNRLMVLQKSKMRDRVDTATIAAQRAAQLAMQKADIAVSRSV